MQKKSNVILKMEYKGEQSWAEYSLCLLWRAILPTSKKRGNAIH